MAEDVVRRETESVAIERLLDSAATDTAGLLVDGERGIGKTTLWLSGVDRARQRGWSVLATRPVEAESVLAYSSLADLLGGVEPAEFARLPAPQQLAIDRVLLRGNVADSPTDPRVVAVAFLKVIDGLSEAGPVLIAIDDLQWLDRSSVKAIAFAARRLSGPVGVFATLRTDPDCSIDSSWLMLPRPDAMGRITVKPLSLGALHEILSQRLRRSFPRRTMVRIRDVSGGNPFYALELARAVADTTEGHDMSFPPTLSEVVRNRIGGLDAAVQDMLLAAACAAAPTVELISRATDTPVARVVELLANAEVKGIIYWEGQRLRFGHPLLAAGVYGDAPLPKRRGMHRRLAGVVTEPELQARHLAMGTLTGDPHTLQSLDAAAQRSRMRGAPAAAAELIELALGLGGDTPQRRIRLAGYLFNSGDGSRARVILKDVASGSTPKMLRAEALNLLAVMSQLEGSLMDAANHLGSALGDVDDNLELRVRILVSLSWVQIHIGQLASSARSVDDAVAYAERLGQPQLLSQAFGMHVLVHLLLGNGVDDQRLRHALEAKDDTEGTSVMFRATVQSTLVLAWTGHLDAARDNFRAIAQNCIECGEESELVFVAFHSALSEIWRADFPGAALIAHDTVERALQLDGELSVSVALTIRALLAAYAGQEDQARRDLIAAIEPVRRSGSQLLLGWTIATVGFLEVSLGNYQSAITTLEPLFERIDSAPNATEIFAAWFLPDAVEALIALGRLAQAEPMIDRLESNGRRLDRAWMLACGGRCRAMLLAARGDLVGSSLAAAQAMTEHERLPMPFERARTQLLVGQLERRQRHNRAAEANLRGALNAFEEIGTPLWAERARTELSRANVGPRSVTTLTTSEQRVAELAASGMTNRDVAAALFISPKTVESHLARTYRKFGIHSRAELGRRMNPRKG